MTAAALWPAPARSSFWSDFAAPVRAVPSPIARSDRHTPTPPRVTISPPPRPAAKPTPPAGEMLCGLALHFDTWCRPVRLPAPLRESLGTSHTRAECRYRAGAFDQWIRKATIGAHNCVRLLFDHDWDKRLCSTMSGALRVRSTPHALFFTVDAAANADARETCRAVRAAASRREVSIQGGLLLYDWHPRPGKEFGALDVYEATLAEISIVERGAFPGTAVDVC